MRTTTSSREGECHAGPSCGGSRGKSIGGEGEWLNRVVTEKESAEHWANVAIAIGTFCPDLESWSCLASVWRV